MMTITRRCALGSTGLLAGAMMAVPIGAAQSAGVNRAAGQVTAYYRFKLGTFTVTALSDGF